MFDLISESVSFIQEKTERVPKIGIVLGSGLGKFIEDLDDIIDISYEEIPHFKPTSVEGHQGRLIFGKISGLDVVCLQGRHHLYEGYGANEVVYPIRVLSGLGVNNLILTNAAGGINKSFSKGQLVLIKDHINLSGSNPLVGPNYDQLGPRFPDMTQAYTPWMRETFFEAAKEIKTELFEGVYCGVLGPTYETPAEIHMMRTIGADMVGMSTVCEAIAANHMGMSVCGLSCITNMAAGIENELLDHQDVKQEALKVMDTFGQLLTTAISLMKNRLN